MEDSGGGMTFDVRSGERRTAGYPREEEDDLRSSLREQSLKDRERGRWIYGASREDLISIIEAAPCGIALQRKPLGKFLYINPACVDITGYDLADTPTPRVGSRKLRPSRKLKKSVQKTVMISSHGEQIIFRFNCISKQGEPKCLEGRTAVASNGMTVSTWSDATGQEEAKADLRKAKERLEHAVEERVSELVSVNRRLCREIETRKNAELELRKSRQELRHLSEHLQRAREEERNSIARHVHDELGQLLSVVKIDVARLGRSRGEDRHKQIDAIEQELSDLIRTTKNICASLRPPALDHAGLAEAVRWHVVDFEQRTGVACTLRVDDNLAPLGEDLSLVVFRVLQEALTNVVRHAGASTIYVSLARKGRKVVLKVRDNGRGISRDDVSKPGSFGIIGMRERIRFWGGKLVFRATPGKGTTFTASIPLDRSKSGRVRGAARDGGR